MSKGKHKDKFDPNDPRFSSNNAARYTGYAEGTFRVARHTGILAGVPAPAFRKVGRKVIYERKVLDEWLEQFKEKANTAT